MAPRDPVLTPSALEKLEAPSREVAEEHRRLLAAEIAEKPGFKDAIDAIEKLEGEQLPDGSPAILPIAPVDGNGTPKSSRKNTEPRPLPRAIQKTSPSLASVLGERRSSAEEETAAPPTPSMLPRIVAGVVGLALVVIAAWLFWGRDGERPTPAPRGTTSSSSATATATAKQSATAIVTAPVTATAIPTDEPALTSAASSAPPSASARSGRPSAKTASAAVDTAPAPKTATATASTTATTTGSATSTTGLPPLLYPSKKQ